MATEIQVAADLTLEAAEDLDSYQFYLVGIDTNGKACLADGTEAITIGPLQNKPKTGQAAQIRYLGVSKVKLGGSVTAGDRLKTSSGKAVTASTDKNYMVGIALASGSTNEIGSMLCTRAYLGV